MTANTNINIRTTAELKASSNEVLRRLGLDMSTAVNIFLTQLVYRNAIPFEISAPAHPSARLGGWEGKGVVSEDFNEPMDEFEELTT
ncbi:MAG: type II toxin-antitoxin system RelB/DinJ family antitoxin [Synergistaceae bacterium]|jgi:DNA-damage-inducible protein J|nr:type II toxin-antitoxin system RelB/DinJ family antitoxin [Synergistaceae bacterium]